MACCDKILSNTSRDIGCDLEEAGYTVEHRNLSSDDLQGLGNKVQQSVGQYDAVILINPSAFELEHRKAELPRANNILQSNDALISVTLPWIMALNKEVPTLVMDASPALIFPKDSKAKATATRDGIVVVDGLNDELVGSVVEAIKTLTYTSRRK